MSPNKSNHQVDFNSAMRSTVFGMYTQGEMSQIKRVMISMLILVLSMWYHEQIAETIARMIVSLIDGTPV